MGKQYTTAPILVNSNGDPIPQYLDITDKTDSPQGTFKPLTNETIQKVQLTGSIVEVVDATNNVGAISAGTSKEYSLPKEYQTGGFKYMTLHFRREGGSGEISSIKIRHTSSHVKSGMDHVNHNEEELQFVGTSKSLNLSKKIELLTGNFTLVFTAGIESDFIPKGIIIYLWRR